MISWWWLLWALGVELFGTELRDKKFGVLFNSHWAAEDALWLADALIADTICFSSATSCSNCWLWLCSSTKRNFVRASSCSIAKESDSDVWEASGFWEWLWAELVDPFATWEDRDSCDEIRSLHESLQLWHCDSVSCKHSFDFFKGTSIGYATLIKSLKTSAINWEQRTD